MSASEPKLSWWEPRWSHRRKLAEVCDVLPSVDGWLRIAALVAALVVAAAWVASRWLPEMQTDWPRWLLTTAGWAVVLPLVFYGLALIPPHVAVNRHGLATTWALSATLHRFVEARSVVLDLSDPARRTLGLTFEGRTVWVGIPDGIPVEGLEEALRGWCPGKVEVVAEDVPAGGPPDSPAG